MSDKKTFVPVSIRPPIPVDKTVREYAEAHDISISDAWVRSAALAHGMPAYLAYKARTFYYLLTSYILHYFALRNR